MPTASEYTVIPEITPDAIQVATPDVGQPEQEIGPLLVECQQILSTVELYLHGDVQSCLNECHGTLGVCHACVLGNLERDLAGAGITVDKCSDRVLADASGTMRELFMAAFGAGIPPPTDAQLSAALAGQPIPEPSPAGEPTAAADAGTDAVTAAAAALAADITAGAQPRITTCPAPFLADLLPDGSEVWVFSDVIYDSAGNYLRCDTRSQVFPPGTQVTGGPPAQPQPQPQPVTTAPVLPKAGDTKRPEPTNGGQPAPIPIFTGPITTPITTPTTFPVTQPQPPQPPPGAGCSPGYYQTPAGTCAPFPPLQPPAPVGPTTPPPPSPPPPQPTGCSQPTDTNPTYFGDWRNHPVPLNPNGTPAYPVQWWESMSQPPTDPPNGPADGGVWCTLEQWNDPRCPNHTWRLLISSNNPWGIGACPATPPSPGPPPPPPYQPPAPTCPTCGAGYHWGTDANGNPACIPDCSCPACPTLPGGGGPPPPEQGPAASSPPSGIEFCDPAEWKLVGATIDQLAKGSDPGGFGAMIAGAVTPQPAESTLELVKHIFFDPFDLIRTGFAGLTTAVGNILTLFPSTAISAGAADSCNSASFRTYAVANAMVGFLNHFGLAPAATAASYRNILNYLCQWQIPSTPELNAAWARNWVTDDEWEYGVKLNGSCVPWQKKTRELARTRIGLTDAYRLWKLGTLSDTEFLDAWREQGVDIDRDLTRWEAAVKVYPPTQDLIRMTVRDVEDQSVVDDYQLDSEFDQKWTGTLQQWGKAQGLEDEVAKRYWRAHWQSPAPTNIFEWLHRLRPVDRDPQDPFADVIFTRADAERALKIADYVPGLIDEYIATSYRPPSRIDLRRLWRVGTFTSPDQLRRGYKDLGYNDVDAQRLADFTVKSEAQNRAKYLGAVPEPDVTKALIAGTLSDDEARQLYGSLGYEQEQIDARITAAHVRADISDRKRILEALRRRFFMGEFSQAELNGELSAAGIPSDRVSQIARVWAAEREAKAKQPAVGMLCQWWSRNLISLDDFFQRVRNLNYKEADALLVVQNCQVATLDKRQKELEREALRIERQQKQRAREAIAAAKLARPYVVVKPRVSLGTQFKRVQTTETKNGKVTSKVTDTSTDQQTEPPTPPPITPL